ncbi:hypothetical protein [Streptomyces sp. NPDC091416]|uniref:hypothetical protein n=1 Tax=Streptomyces sp. NPDC091416 TaxID=3366003 RepID=UPI0037F24637
MAFGRRKNETPATAPAPAKRLPASMPTRLPKDPRGKGYETDYQASRGGWLKKG